MLHPNVIPIHSVSADGATPHLVMAYIRGGSLQKRLEKDGALPLIEVLRIGAQIAAGLAALMIRGSCIAISSQRTSCSKKGSNASRSPILVWLGLWMTTPSLSRERSRGPDVYVPRAGPRRTARPEERSVQLGSVLYALCTGQPPYRADSSYGVMRKIIDESPTPLREQNPAIPEWMAQIVEKLMARDKADRFASAAEVHRLLEAGLKPSAAASTHPIPVVPGVRPRAEQKPFLKTRTGVMTMTALTLAAMLCIAVVSQSGRPSLTVYGPPATEGVAKPAARQPSLIVESHQKKVPPQQGRPRSSAGR